MFGLLAGLGGIGYLMANPRRKAKHRKAKRSAHKRRRVTKRRGAYVVRLRVSSAERRVITAARSQRMSAIAAKRKLQSIGDRYLGSHYKVNPQYGTMMVTRAEAALVKSARSARMKAVAAHRGRRSASALEGVGEGYESYTMDNPRRKRRARRSR
jgi:phosphoribosylformylglycinamidine (FGAM) synthase-like enzyme